MNDNLSLCPLCGEVMQHRLILPSTGAYATMELFCDNDWCNVEPATPEKLEAIRAWNRKASETQGEWVPVYPREWPKVDE